MKNTTYASHYDIVDTLDKDNVNKNLYKLDIENIIKQYNIINGENSFFLI